MSDVVRRYTRFILRGERTPRLARLESDGAYTLLDEGGFCPPLPLGRQVDESEISWWLPPCRPTKIVAVGKNYRAHAAEFDGQVPEVPLLFGKALSSLSAHRDRIVRPEGCGRFDLEGELAVVMGHRASRVGESSALQYVAGFTVANDVTCRDWQKADGQFHRGKSADGTCPIGPYLVQGISPDDLGIETRLNGKTVQSGRTGQMIFSIARLVAYISSSMTLEPGDVILTGTPAGVTPMLPGDVVEVEIEGLGVLQNEIIG